MGTVHAAATCRASVHQAQTAWCDTGRWPAWVEGLERVILVGEGWPAAGSSVRWESGPAGRGSVTERVRSFQPLAEIESEIEDDQVVATQVVSFVPLEAGVEVRLDFAYRITRRSPLTPLVDWLFVRRAMAASLEATLARFAVEAESTLP